MIRGCPGENLNSPLDSGLPKLILVNAPPVFGTALLDLRRDFLSFFSL